MIFSQELNKINDPLKYQSNKAESKSSCSDEWATIKFSYQAPEEDMSKLIVHPIKNSGRDRENASENLRFAASLAEFGMLLRNSKFKGTGNYGNVTQMAGSAIGEDKEGYSKKFLKLVRKVSGMIAGNKNEKENPESLTGMYR